MRSYFSHPSYVRGLLSITHDRTQRQVHHLWSTILTGGSISCPTKRGCLQMICPGVDICDGMSGLLQPAHPSMLIYRSG
jgi:hypothetical protein